MSREEAARFLRVSDDFIDKLCRSGAIRAFKAGRRVLISVTSLVSYVEGNPVHQEKTA